MEVRVGNGKQFVAQIPFRDWHAGASWRRTALDEIGDERDAFAGRNHAGEDIEVQGGGAETRSEPGLAAKLLRRVPMRVDAVVPDVEKRFLREISQANSGSTRERMFGNKQDDKRAAKNLDGL